MKAYLASVGAYLPARRMHNDELATIVETSDDWIYSHTGIRWRHLAADDEATSDLAAAAARVALERASVAPEEVDLVLIATGTPDHLSLPSTASIVQEKLGLPRAGAMDVVAACSGFGYALETARAYVVSGAAKTVLTVGAETYSRILNWEDRSTCVLFGDGAGAVVVRGADDGDTSVGEIYPAILGSDGAGWQALVREIGGSRTPLAPDAVGEPAGYYLSMDGRAVYQFAVGTIIDTISELLRHRGLTFSDLAWVVPHQANTRIINAACKRAGWDAGHFYTNMDRVANTSGASIPIALNDLYEAERIRRGDLFATVGFGGGLSWAGNLVRW